MTNVKFTIKLDDIDDSDDESARQICESMMKSWYVLLGPEIKWSSETEGRWFIGWLMYLPDYKAQAVEEIMGQGLWDVSIH
jgi:hypothetical protein